MAVITGDLYQSFTKPEASGGRLVPIAGGKLHVGVWGSDPTEKNAEGNYINHIPVYYIDGQSGVRVELPNPIPLNSAGKPEFQGKVIQVETDEELYSIAVMNSANQVPAGYANYRSGAKEAFDELNAACQEFGVPYSEAGVSIKHLTSGMDITGVYGLIASDGSLWINNGLSGVVTNVPSPMLGIIDIDGNPQSLIKKRDENRYQSVYNYKEGDLVFGSDNKQYFCIAENGPSHGGSVNPVSDTGSKWLEYPYKTTKVSNGIGTSTVKQWFDGTLEISGRGFKQNGVPAALVVPWFSAPEFKESPSVVLTGTDILNNADAKIFDIKKTEFSVVVIDLTTGAANGQPKAFSYRAVGEWR